MEWNGDEGAVQLYKKSCILQMLQESIESLFYEELNRHKISLLGVYGSVEAERIENQLMLIDQLISGIEHNIGCGNLKRALHFLILLRQLIRQTQERLDVIDYGELVM